MNWREYLKDRCTFCNVEIIFTQKFDHPDLNYYGFQLPRPNGKLWHAQCAFIRTLLINKGIHPTVENLKIFIDKNGRI